MTSRKFGKRGRMFHDTDRDEFVLEIKDCKPGDGGQFSVEAFNERGSAVADTTVKVLAKPQAEQTKEDAGPEATVTSDSSAADDTDSSGVEKDQAEGVAKKTIAQKADSQPDATESDQDNTSPDAAEDEDAEVSPEDQQDSGSPKKSLKLRKAKKVTTRKDTVTTQQRQLKKASLLRLGPPQILMSPESLLVPEGEPIRLKYKVTGKRERMVGNTAYGSKVHIF